MFMGFKDSMIFRVTCPIGEARHLSLKMKLLDLFTKKNSFRCFLLILAQDKLW